MKVAIGCDPNGTELKATIKKHLNDLGYEWEDYGSNDPIYPNVAIKVAEAVASGKHQRGILICGTGIGMCIAANKVPGAYAALCSDAYSAERARKSNNANIMTLGAQVMGPELAKTLVDHLDEFGVYARRKVGAEGSTDMPVRKRAGKRK